MTSAIAYVTSSSSASLTPRAAAIAETPQIEKPVATRSESPSETPSRSPAQRVPKNVATTTTTTTSSPRRAEREHVLEDELEAEQHDPDAEERPRREREPGAGGDGDAARVRDEEAERDRDEHDRHSGKQLVREQPGAGAREGERQSRGNEAQRRAGDSAEGRNVQALGHLNDQVALSIAC